MLILSRKLNESIIISEDIHIEVLGWNAFLVKLGISAPRHIPVHREEIYHRIKQEKSHSIPRY